MESVIRCRAAPTVEGSRRRGDDEYLRALFYTGDKPNVPRDRFYRKYLRILLETRGEGGRGATSEHADNESLRDRREEKD